MSALLEALLAKPIAPQRPAVSARDFTRKLEISQSTATATLVAEPGATVNEGTALRFLEDEGQNPAEWEVTGFRKIEYGQGMESTRFTFRRIGPVVASILEDEELRAMKAYRPKAARAQGDHTFMVLLGDMQFGKIDGDGVAGTLERTISCLEKAADALEFYRKRYDIGHVHVAWLGDHVEGFESQGGANAWRTPMPLNDQIRVTRRTMLHGLLTFSDLAERVTMVAVPGNHGEAVRFQGSGITRYDDSHDTESLIAVMDGARLTDKFDHVEFYVPQTDELSVALDLSGTVTAHTHGHKWRPGKHLDWWKGQAFNRESAFHGAHLLVAGHLHHEFVDTDGDRTFIQPPAMESESTWWRHSKGTTGAPGLIVGVTRNGEVPIKELIR